MCGIIDSGSWNTCHSQTGMRNCGFAICSSLMMREIVCSFIFIFKHFNANFWGEDSRWGQKCFSNSCKEKQISNIRKKNGALLNLAIIFTFSPILTCEPFHQWIFPENIQHTGPPSTEGLLVWTPYPSGNSNLPSCFLFWNFVLLEKILVLRSMITSILYYCKGLITIKIIRDGY